MTGEAPRVRKKVEPEPGSRLHGLLSLEADLSREEAAAKSRLKEVRDGIRAELQREFDPDQMPDVIEVPADARGAFGRYSLTWYPPGWVIDSERMKSEDPQAYVNWVKPRKGYWKLEGKEG